MLDQNRTFPLNFKFVGFSLEDKNLLYKNASQFMIVLQIATSLLQRWLEDSKPINCTANQNL